MNVVSYLIYIYKETAFQTQKPFYIKALTPKHPCGIDRFSTPLFEKGFLSGQSNFQNL